MKKSPLKIGVSGTHSTGKTKFLTNLASLLKEHDLNVGRVDDVARRAQSLGFPILKEHTYESTLWIMAECMRQEAEASLTCDVILVDRPVPDAFGYLLAALEASRRRLPSRRIDSLRAIAHAHTSSYDLLVVTSLDDSVPLGEGRDTDLAFRKIAATHIDSLMSELAPDAQTLSSTNSAEITAIVNEFISSSLASG